METLATIILILCLAAIVLLAGKWQRAPGKYEHIHVPDKEQPPEPPAWLSFRVSGGSVHVKISRIQNFGYSLTCQSLTINDGTESPLTIPDPDGRSYERLCRYFGLTPIPRPEWPGRPL